MNKLLLPGDAAKAGSKNRSGEFRPDDDHFPTPLEAIYPVIRHLAMGHKIWEPACGEGHIAEVLTEYGYDVTATTLIDRGYGETGVDFLRTKKLRAPVIFSNPPFSLDEEFVLHSLNLGAELVIFFLRLKWLCGADRYRRIHSQTPPCLVLPYIQRITFHAGDTAKSEQPGWNTEDFAWFVWRKGYMGKPSIDWLSRDDGVQKDLFRTNLEKGDGK